MRNVKKYNKVFQSLTLYSPTWRYYIMVVFIKRIVPMHCKYNTEV